jgi:hypothetical protein
MSTYHNVVGAIIRKNAHFSSSTAVSKLASEAKKRPAARVGFPRRRAPVNDAGGSPIAPPLWPRYDGIHGGCGTPVDVMSETVRAIRECVARTHATMLQNILMRMPDKVCALGFQALPESTREELYALIAPLKAARIKEEIRLEARRRTGIAVKEKILRGFLSYFGEAEKLKKRIYIRPKRKG